MLTSKKCQNDRRGAMLVLIAITLPLMLIMVAFALDVAWMQLVRTELRTATDAAARAAAKQLSLQQDQVSARKAAKDTAAENLVAGTPLVLRDEDIVFGFSDQANDASRFVFTPGGDILNAVKVTGNRTSTSAGGPVALFLGNIMGVPNFEPSLSAVSTQLDRDICLVVDRSGSMMLDDQGRTIRQRNCSPPHERSKWAALDAAVGGFLDELDATVQQEQCGLVSYSSEGSNCGFTFTTSDINALLSFDYSTIRSAMADIGSRPVAGRTNIYAGIENGIAVLTDSNVRPFALKTMVVMTDGIHNTGPEPVIAAQDAAAQGITVHTVTFSDEADVARMQAVAEATGGRHFHAPDAAALERIFREIAATLPVMLTN